MCYKFMLEIVQGKEVLVIIILLWLLWIQVSGLQGCHHQLRCILLEPNAPDVLISQLAVGISLWSAPEGNKHKKITTSTRSQARTDIIIYWPGNVSMLPQDDKGHYQFNYLSYLVYPLIQLFLIIILIINSFFLCISRAFSDLFLTNIELLLVQYHWIF